MLLYLEVCMFEIFNSLFGSKDKKNSVDSLAEQESAEKKKCKRCLRRVNLEFERCPYCRCSEFCDE